MKSRKRFNTMIRSCDRAIAIYVAVSQNCALTPQIRKRARVDAYRMRQVKNELYRTNHQPALFN